MATMTFRFTTECEMTLSGDSYEDIYLKFKDFQHGKRGIQHEACLEVFPPESDQVFFKLEQDGKLHEIPHFKGAFDEDIFLHCSSSELSH